jgi:DNA-directed RNA polymerase subunit RPC12/RpoP
MKYLCPVCGNTLATEDTFFYTCLNCDEIFTTEELAEEYGLEISGCNSGSCGVDH